jgi:prepilin-type processing-associated H-X9-DG protein/prepilin-type N-terminal cleavage/methylation domain-containing protein
MANGRRDREFAFDTAEAKTAREVRGTKNMSSRDRRSGFSVIELLVVIAIIAILLSLIAAAAQKARSAADRAYCMNNLRQMGIGLTSYASLYGAFPPGTDPFPVQSGGLGHANSDYSKFGCLSWMTWILPYMDNQTIWNQVPPSFAANSNPDNNPPHVVASMILKWHTCPGDARVLVYQHVGGWLVALTSYLGVNGTNLRAHDGVLYACYPTMIRPADITDGLSQTLMIGERPPSADMYFGWWYAGAGQWDSSQGVNINTGCADVTLGTQEINLQGSGLPEIDSCPKGPYVFAPGSLTNNCDTFHFWSLHQGGANFAFADGHVRFIPYSAAAVLPALGTRAGGEPVNYDY